MTPFSRRLRAACVALATASSAGCDRAAPTQRSVLERAVALAPGVERAAGLRFTAPPRVEVRTRDQVHAFVARTLDEPATRAELASVEAAYRRLGVLPAGDDLRALLANALDEQVAGYYDPKSRTLYVVKGADDDAAEATVRHELVHALQDQHRNLDSLLSARGDADRTTAAHAALEGQATWAQLGGADLGDRAWERARRQIRDNAGRSAALAAAPAVVREGLLFPYLSGTAFVRAVAARGRADSLVRRLPASTEQVLHADAYLRGDAPVPVALPAVRPATLASQNTLGEFDTRLMLSHHLADSARATRAAQGWGGDRWGIVRAGGGEAFVWLTVWDGARDADEFFDAMTAVVPRRYPDARSVAAAPPPRAAGARKVAPEPAGRAREFAVGGAGGGRQLVLRAGEVRGRPAVLYVDAPNASAADRLRLDGVGFDRVEFERPPAGR